MNEFAPVTLDAPPGARSEVPPGFGAAYRPVDRLLQRGRLVIGPAAIAYPFVFAILFIPLAFIMDGYEGGLSFQFFVLLALLAVGYAFFPTLAGALALFGSRRRRRRYHDDADLRLRTTKQWFLDGSLSEGHYDVLKERFESYRTGDFLGERILRASTAMIAAGVLSLPWAVVGTLVSIDMFMFDYAGGGLAVGLVTFIAALVVPTGLLFGFRIRSTGRRLVKQEAAAVDAFEDDVLRQAREGKPAAAKAPRMPTMRPYAVG